MHIFYYIAVVCIITESWLCVAEMSHLLRSNIIIIKPDMLRPACAWFLKITSVRMCVCVCVCVCVRVCVYVCVCVCECVCRL